MKKIGSSKQRQMNGGRIVTDTCSGCGITFSYDSGCKGIIWFGHYIMYHVFWPQH